MGDSLNSWLDDLPPEENVVEDTGVIQAVPAADLMVAVPEATASFEVSELETSMQVEETAALESESVIEEVTALLGEIRQAGGISRQLALEAFSLYADGLEKPHINSYTAHPTRTNLNVSVEGLMATVATAVAAIVTAILAAIRRIYVWIGKKLGLSSGNTDAVDAAKAAEAAAEDSVVVSAELGMAEDDVKAVSRELAGMEDIFQLPNDKLPIVDRFIRSGRSANAYDAMATDAFFADLVAQGPFTTNMVQFANNVGNLIVPQYQSFIKELNSVLRDEVKGDEGADNRARNLQRMRDQMRWDERGRPGGRFSMGDLRKQLMTQLDKLRGNSRQNPINIEKALMSLRARTERGAVLSVMYKNTAMVMRLLETMEEQLKTIESLFGDAIAGGTSPTPEQEQLSRKANAYLRALREDCDDLRLISVMLIAQADAVRRYIAQVGNMLTGGYVALAAALERKEVSERLDAKQYSRVQTAVLDSKVRADKLRMAFR